MEEFFPILVALTVAFLAWGVTALVMGLVRGDRRKLAERLSGTSASTGACECRHGRRYGSPFRPSESGRSTVAVRPESPSAITSHSPPSAACSRTGQRTSRGKRSPPDPGT